jgi:translation elongation factor EF-1alpha
LFIIVLKLFKFNAEKNRDTWYYAFIVDINEEERQKGKTVEVGRASFELEKTRFTILVGCNCLKNTFDSYTLDFT